MAHLLAIVCEDGLISREKMADEINFSILIETDAHHCEVLRRELLGDLIDHGIFVAARFAPGSPEIHDQRLAAVFRENLLVACEINYRRIWSFCSLRNGRLSLLPAVLRPSWMNCRQRKKQN